MSWIPCISCKLVMTSNLDQTQVRLWGKNSPQAVACTPIMRHIMSRCLYFGDTSSHHSLGICESHKNDDILVPPFLLHQLESSVRRNPACFLYPALSTEGSARKSWEALGTPAHGMTSGLGQTRSHCCDSLSGTAPPGGHPSFSHSVVPEY